ncbi:MAG: Na+/H+ antiporter [Acidobacteriaceae bacterium]|nr:Na+/H+ antiporter [Acidobacteriaceae bacterium]
MQDLGISHVELLVLVLLLLVAALAFLAKRLSIPYPIVLVLGGLCLSLVPEAPRVSLDPNIVFFAILPPLLFSAAFHTSWREFRNNLVSIIMLAFGLVGFTIYGVAAVTRWMLPAFNWKLGLVLGAVVATTDPISATATAKRLGIPRKITDLLEAESLVNDGSGLVALKFTAALLITGVTPSFLLGTGELLYLIFAGVVIGLIIGVAVHKIQRRITDAPIEITISLVTPYLAYLAAEGAQCSGVMATLACGLYLGRHSSGYFSLRARIESSAVWNTLDFMLNGIVFLVLGLQLPSILAGIEALSRKEVIVDGALFSLLVILLRLLWVYPGSWISSRIRRYVDLNRTETFSPAAIFVVGWSGMRGVLALAAAISLPERLNNGLPFPQRNLLIFLTFCVIFATLVLQGLSLPALMRRLGLTGALGTRGEEELARREMITAALESLERLRQEGSRERAEIHDQLERYYRRRLALLGERAAKEGRPPNQQFERQDSLAQQLRAVERSIALKLRNENKIHDEVLRALERELDLLDARFAEAEY